jgi:hypothetical protein
MKKELLNKPGAEAGWALIRLTFAEGDARPRPEESFTLAIQELPSEIFFQPAGPAFWPQGGPECYVPPHAQSFDGQTLTLELGPPVVATFRAHQYAFHIKGSYDFQYTFMTNIGALRRPASWNPALTIGPGPAPTLPRVQPAQAVPEPVAPEPETPVPETAALDDPPLPPPLGKEPRRSARLALCLGLAVLILGLAGLGFWLWKRAEKTGPPAPSTPFAGQAEQAPSPAPGVGPANETPPLEEARELLRRGAGAAELEAALARLEQRPGAEDAVFILAKALAPSAPRHRVRYAAFMDPTDTRPTGSIKKDPLAAYDEYEQARAAGAPEAAEALDRLRRWALAAYDEYEQAKAAGAPEAAEALDRLRRWAEENAENDETGAARLWRRYGGSKP